MTNEVRPRNTTNIHSELQAIERQIEYFDGVEYSSSLNHYCGGSTPYPFSGLDEEDFHYIKNSLIKMLNDCHNKKSQELINFLSNNKKRGEKEMVGGVIMTTQEAIEIIKSNRPTSGYTLLNEALDVAIDALKRLPELEEKAWMYDECNK